MFTISYTSLPHTTSWREESPLLMGLHTTWSWCQWSGKCRCPTADTHCTRVLLMVHSFFNCHSIVPYSSIFPFCYLGEAYVYKRGWLRIARVWLETDQSDKSCFSLLNTTTLYTPLQGRNVFVYRLFFQIKHYYVFYLRLTHLMPTKRKIMQLWTLVCPQKHIFEIPNKI